LSSVDASVSFPRHECFNEFDKGSAKTLEKVSPGKIGKYEIISALGSGGMGEVFLALDEVLGRKVAIKRPHKSAPEVGLARFQIEAKAAALRHPNIPAIYETGMEGNLPFIVMEYVEGQSLREILAAGDHLDLIAKLSIVEQVCLALGYAHANGIIHRDIKPSNVIVQLDKEKRSLVIAKIIDFGIAKMQATDGQAALTQASQLIGTMHYIAPERFKDGPIDGRADLFSAGVLLFKLLTGVEPFPGGETSAWHRILNEEHSQLGTYISEYPPALDEIVEKSLAKDPEDRYHTGEDMAGALHDAIEDLKRSRVLELFSDAERLTMENRFTPALELLEEAAKLDPVNTQVKKLRKFVRDHNSRLKRSERIRECVVRADEALLSGNFEEAINHLKDAETLDPNSAEVRQRIHAVEDKKRRYEMSARALSDAETARSRGDITAATRIVARALQEDTGNQKLLALKGALARQVEIEAQRVRILGLLENARRRLADGESSEVDKLLVEVESIDPSNLDADKLRRELTRAREQEERRSAVDSIQTRVDELLRTESYDEAADLLNRAIDELPDETTLHRLKAEVDSEARRFEAKRFVDAAISQARELFATSPDDALAVIQKALEEMPSEERLVSYEQSLREQLDAIRIEQVHAETLRKVRELMSDKQFNKAILVLDSFQLEFGRQEDIDDLLVLAKDELANQQRCAAIERCAAEGRARVRDGRLEDAIRSLEDGVQETGDASLLRLLEEVRQQQAAFARSQELLRKRVALLRERGELDEAMHLVEEQLYLTPRSAPIQELLVAVRAEQEQRQATANAIASARAAMQKKDFLAGLESLQTVVGVYGESPDLARATQELEAERSRYAEEVVEKSIESARAALLKNDSKSALAALQDATQMMEFADAKRQADWQRMRQSVKKVIEQPKSAGGHAVFDAQLSEMADATRRRIPSWAFIVAGLALVGVISIAVWDWSKHSALPASPPPPIEAKIRIAKAPAGSAVRIDDGPPLLVGDNGEVIVAVQRGSRHIVVSKEGFDDFLDTVTVDPGSTVQENVSMIKSIPAGTETGTLSPVPQTGLTNFKVYVDGALMGEKQAGEKIPLKVGPHVVKYAWPGYQDFKDHRIRISKDLNVQDKFELALITPPPPSTGRLAIHTTGGAHVAVDGQLSGTADSSGSYIIDDLKPGEHTVVFSLDDYQATSKQVTIVAGQALPLEQQLQAIPPTGLLTVSSDSIEKGKSVQLTWDVKHAKTVSISNYGDGLGAHGKAPVTPETTTTYGLTASGIPLAEVTVTVTEPSTPGPRIGELKPLAPVLPDRAALESALDPYKKVFAEAAGRNCKDAFRRAYYGKLSNWAVTCDAAKSFEAVETSCRVSGSSEAPMLTCEETILIHPKDGDTYPSKRQRAFRFTKSPEGNWQIAGW
jgi:serine/threonine-protein kinase